MSYVDDNDPVVRAWKARISTPDAIMRAHDARYEWETVNKDQERRQKPLDLLSKVAVTVGVAIPTTLVAGAGLYGVAQLAVASSMGDTQFAVTALGVIATCAIAGVEAAKKGYGYIDDNGGFVEVRSRPFEEIEAEKQRSRERSRAIEDSATSFKDTAIKSTAGMVKRVGEVLKGVLDGAAQRQERKALDILLAKADEIYVKEGKDAECWIVTGPNAQNSFTLKNRAEIADFRKKASAAGFPIAEITPKGSDEVLFMNRVGGKLSSEHAGDPSIEVVRLTKNGEMTPVRQEYHLAGAPSTAEEVAKLFEADEPKATSGDPKPM